VARQRSGGTPATAALTRAGVTFTVHEYHHDPSADSYGLEAADALGLSYRTVFKTLIAEVDGRPCVALVAVDKTLDLKALAAAVGGKRAVMAPVADAERITGYVAGGISPLGQRRPLPTVVDAGATELDQIYVSGGKRGLDLGLSPSSLIELTSASVAPIAR
jgi:Cys-tRNA(Pro)/Cys-tRNA(Cys) deacylase